MDDENASCAHDDEEHAQLSLLRLPVEVFLHICSFLDASTLVHGLSLVCKQFYQILKDDDLLWKTRINHIWPNATHSLFCPAGPNKLFWKLSCVAIEQTALWKQPDSMEKLMLINSRIKAVLLMHVDGITYLISKKDGILLYKKLSYREEPFYEVRDDLIDVPRNCLTAIDHTVYSCSYDNIIKSWVLTNTGLVHDRTYEIERSNRNNWLTCVSSCPERALFAIGSSCGGIDVFDSRSSNKLISHYRPHTTDVTRLVMNMEYILSNSGNKTVPVWDQRAGRIMTSITIPGQVGTYPKCMSMRRDNWVCVGDCHSKLHMLDPKNDFEIVKSYSTEHKSLIKGVRLTHGCLITSSYDGTVRISSSTDPPRSIATLDHGLGEKTNMDYLNDTLAIAGDGLVVWRPRNRRV